MGFGDVGRRLLADVVDVGAGAQPRVAQLGCLGLDFLEERRNVRRGV